MRSLLILATVFSIGCTSVSTMNRIHSGMTREQVINEVGEPKVTVSNGSRETCIYRVWENPGASAGLAMMSAGLLLLVGDQKTDCSVVLEDGKVIQEAICKDTGFGGRAAAIGTSMAESHQDTNSSWGTQMQKQQSAPAYKQTDQMCMSRCTSSGSQYLFCRSKCDY